MFFARLIVDINVSDGIFAWLALQSRVGYIGIAFTEEHKEQVMARLALLMKTAMSERGSKLYNAAYASAIVGEAHADNPGANVGGGRGGRGGRGGHGGRAGGRGRGCRCGRSGRPSAGPAADAEPPTTRRKTSGGGGN